MRSEAPPPPPAAYLDEVLHSAVGVSLNVGLYPDEGLDLSVEAVGHELKLPIRRDEGDGPVVLKAREADTLVELDVLQLYCLAARPCMGGGRDGGRLGKVSASRPVFSKRILSLSPSLSSGMPVSRTFIFTEPTISLCRTCPVLLTCSHTHTHTHRESSECE